MKKRLLKDLPFGNLNKDTVLYRVNGSYQLNNGKTYYETGHSDNGCFVCNSNEKGIIDLIWDNPDWFEDASLSHIDLIPTTTSLTLRFKPIDIEDAEYLAMGIVHILEHLQEGNYVWNKFKNITTKITNR
jgi:hypothetical protein